MISNTQIEMIDIAMHGYSQYSGEVFPAGARERAIQAVAKNAHCGKEAIIAALKETLRRDLEDPIAKLYDYQGAI